MRRLAITLAALVTLCGGAQAGETSFSTVPANICDAPVTACHGVTREDGTYHANWRAVFANGAGLVVISQMHPGRHWTDTAFSSEDRVLRMFEKDGLRNFRRVETTSHAGRQWGHMAVADWRGQVCVVGLALKRDHNAHDTGGEGGTLLAQAFDCASGAVGRYAAWQTWFRSFKPVQTGYNASLDR